MDEIKDRKARHEISMAIDGLARHPGAQGKALLSPFEGVRSLKAVRGRYRILYRLDEKERSVQVLLIGKREPGQEGDVYALARKLLDALMEEE